ncbi:MAG: hypothetical protein HY892_22925 [Deltaproteobacteria bacterium]|nr:hypothetical protein [Deltaproteobacteria bacterium]
MCRRPICLPRAIPFPLLREFYILSRLFRDARSLSLFAGATEITKLISARRLGLWLV